MSFQFVPKLVTLNDLERCNGPCRSFGQGSSLLWSLDHTWDLFI